jgi:ABC-2 type transport system ATP-binding protein
MGVKVESLFKIYGEQNAVNGISFQAQKGEILGFLGPNGAGKSTTMKIATGYIPPSSGSVVIEGYDVVEDPIAVQKNVGYLPEHNPLYLDMYVHEYLGFIGSVHGLKGSLLSSRVKEMINLVGLGREQNKRIGMLSKGYRQRIGLAQALIHNPAVLILDEPTTGLDPNQILEIRSLIKNISKEKTVIFSTHIMQEVQALCDRVVIINLGNIVADSTIADLQKKREGFVLITEFDKPVQTDAFANIAGLTAVEDIGNNTYKMYCGKEDIRGEVFRIATENNWSLIGLKQEEDSLEAVFQQLTSNKTDKI